MPYDETKDTAAQLFESAVDAGTLPLSIPVTNDNGEPGIVTYFCDPSANSRLAYSKRRDRRAMLAIALLSEAHRMAADAGYTTCQPTSWS